MAWVKVDDKFARGRKVKRAARLLGGKRARGRVLAVWLDAMSYCNLNLTDGAFPDDELDELPDANPSEVFEAMSKGDEELGAIVERARNGWLFRNYADYQPTKADVEAKLERDRNRKKLHAESTRNPHGGNTDSKHTEPDRSEPDRAEPFRPEPTEPVEVQTNSEVQRDRPAPRPIEFETVTEHLKAATYAHLAEHPDADDGELAEVVKQAAASMHVYDYTGRKVTAIVNNVRGYLASQESKAVNA